MNHLVVARWTEPLYWFPQVTKLRAPWAVTVVQNGLHRPNQGREAGAFLWWILENYHRLALGDVYAFVQADPTPHCPELFARLDQLEPRAPWQSLSGYPSDTDGQGGPWHPGLPVAETFERITGRAFPEDGTVFGHGGQWAAGGTVLLEHPREFYERLYVEACDEERRGPWVLERIWHLIIPVAA